MRLLQKIRREYYVQTRTSPCRISLFHILQTLNNNNINGLISIGSLGHDTIEEVRVWNSSITGASSAIKIKTWQVITFIHIKL